MKKIIISLSVIAAVAAVAIGATTAFFSDTETSKGNVFTAGAIDLTVDSTCHYFQLDTQGQPTIEVGCGDGVEHGNWSATDLGADYKFFNFSDVKPGDSGENTISLHVNNNDAWVRLVIKDLTDLDNSCTEPEDAMDNTCDDTQELGGELRENLLFSMWVDEGVTPGFGLVQGVADIGEGDNIWQSGEPELIFEGMIDSNGTAGEGISEIWALPYPLLGGQTAYFGVAWNLPFLTGNEVQTDSMSATMEFQVQQVRNNPTPVWN